MGLKKTIELPSGIQVSDAYLRIKTTIVEWDVGIVRLILGCWVSREASKTGKQELPINGLDMAIAVSDLNTVGQKEAQYELLKQNVAATTNHILKDAQDVFEEGQMKEV